MTIIERIREICKERKLPVSKLEKELGYGNGYLNPKKISAIPSDRLVEIANYLNIPVSEITVGIIKNPAAKTGNGAKIGKLFSLDDEGRRLFESFLELAEENPDTAKRFLEFAVQELRSGKRVD